MTKKLEIKQITRHGAYGVVLRDATILLTQKKSGPYKGLWGLPGGGIEFGETPEDALKRELLEETALCAGSLELLNIATATCAYDNHGEVCHFHHIGIIYKVSDATPVLHLIPEEEMRWVSLHDFREEEITPFAKHVLSKANTGTWRPYDYIRVKVIGIAKRNNKMLVCEVLDDHGKIKGWCPLGGGVEFGETMQEALKREIQEELGCGIRITGELIVCENIFKHHDVKGHETVFAFPIEFENPQIYTKDRFQIFEQRGSVHWVEWVDIERFQKGKAVLFPPCLVGVIV